MTTRNRGKLRHKRSMALAFVFLAVTFAVVPSATSAPGDVEQRVEAILSRMTLDQKIDLIGGQDDF